MADSISPEPVPAADVANASHTLVGSGPRATEDLLFAEVERHLQSRAAPAQTIRIVVPSGSLRRHLIAELVRRQAAWLGVEVVTLRRLALEIFERSGVTPPGGDALLALLVRREALREPALARPLAPLEGGFAPLVATVRDLLDAGLEAAHGRALDELLADEGMRIAFSDRPRAAAVVAVAARVAKELDRLGAAPGALLYRLAAERLATDTGLLPPARRWLAHGFADATGSALDLLERLLFVAPATLLLDLPDSATGLPRTDDETFGASLRSRLLGAARRAAPPPHGSASLADLEAFSALGESGEAAEVARRIRAARAADPGVRLEQIGVVARSLEPHLPALRRAFEAAALPFSVEGAGEADPARREALALVRLLDRREATEVDFAVDLLAPGLGSVRAATEVRVALRLLGVSQISELAELRGGEIRDVPLPVREIGAEEDGEPRARRRRVRARELARWSGAARKLLDSVRAVPERAAARRQIGALAALARRALPAEGQAALWLARALARLAGDLPAEMLLGRDEVAEALARRTEEFPPIRCGGMGGGVQVLPVTAARARTFDRLYVIGLRRGFFPRIASEDPLLPDAVRREARALLPDLQVKSESYAEERFLFDQLLAAAPHVVLSFAAVADDGSVELVSPLLDRLSWRDDESRSLRRQWQVPVNAAPPDDLPAPPALVARRRGLAGDRAGWSRALAAARAEARGRGTIDERDRAIARHRAALLDELDPDPRTAAGQRRWRVLGPFFGRTGAGSASALYVTRVEGLVRCAWLDFLRGALGLEPLPDLAGELPEPLDPLRVGEATHLLLERLIGERLVAQPPADWSALAAPPPAIEFPDAANVAHHALTVARELLDRDGLTRWGFQALLASAILERAERARRDWMEEPRHVVGVELEGQADLSPFGAPRSLAFRADRVDFDGERWVLTDYKTGRPDKIAALARRDKLTAAIVAGGTLQPATYVAALSGRPAVGRLVALAPPSGKSPDDAVPVAAVDERSAEALAGLARVARFAGAARDVGAFLPRLVDATGDERGAACKLCELVEACLQEDSGARGRLARWAEDQRRNRRQEGAASAGAEGADADLFLVPEYQVDPGGET